MSATSRAEILEHLKKVFEDEFDIPPEDITLDSHLVDDLDIDSLDAIDLIANISSYTGRTVDPERFREVRTVADIVDVIVELSSQAA